MVFTNLELKLLDKLKGPPQIYQPASAIISSNSPNSAATLHAPAIHYQATKTSGTVSPPP
jgi:hypothetical protein